MKKVICDTNIWYGLGNGTLQKPGEVKLVATWNNIIEIGFSHKEIKSLIDEESVKLAAKAIIDHADEIIFENPFQFVANKLIPDLQLKVTDPSHILHEIVKSGLADQSTYLQHKPTYDNFIKIKNDFQTSINSNLKETKNSIKKAKKVDLRNEFLLGVIHDIGSYLMLEHSKKIVFEEDDLRKTLDQIDQLFQLITSVKIAFFELFASQKDMKVQPNDYFDLLNLYYVTNDDLYWTLEKRWKKYLISNIY